MYGILKDRENFKDYFEERKLNPKPEDESVEEIQKRAANGKIFIVATSG